MRTRRGAVVFAVLLGAALTAFYELGVLAVWLFITLGMDHDEAYWFNKFTQAPLCFLPPAFEGLGRIVHLAIVWAVLALILYRMTKPRAASGAIT